MTIPTLTPPCNPSPGFTTTPEVKLLKAEFGDGYSQVSPNGLNHVRAVVETVSWDVLAADERDDLIAFFTERGGNQPFLYAFPHGQVLKWTCEQWSDQAISGGFHRVTAKFTQSFDLRT